MDLNETTAFVIAVNQHDPRVQANDISDAIWHSALAPFPRDLAWAAVVEHYRLNDNVTATPAMIRKRASNMLEQRRSKERAIQVAKERELLGSNATPIEVVKLRESFNTVLKSVNGHPGELVQFNRPEHTDWANEEPAA